MRKLSLCILLGLLVLGIIGCSSNRRPESVTGVKEAIAEVELGSDGYTTEQRNIRERIKRDNSPGSIKHLYVFSTMSGQCVIYSTVKGKVTSSGKRLSPTKVAIHGSEAGFPFGIGGRSHYTDEVLQDDGTYGSSIDYLYWFDSKNIFHQHYVAGGAIVHVAEQPMPVKNIIVNIEEHNR